MPDILTIIMRWVHISSVATLVGSLLYARLVETRALSGLPADARQAAENRSAAAFHPVVTAAIIALIVSGLYRLLIARGHTAYYHMLFGIKMLLVLHVFAVAVLIARPNNPRRGRMLTGTLISGFAIIFISAWLSRIY